MIFYFEKIIIIYNIYIIWFLSYVIIYIIFINSILFKSNYRYLNDLYTLDIKQNNASLCWEYPETLGKHAFYS